MKKLVLGTLLLSSIVFANQQKDIVINGCTDIMKNRHTKDAMYTIGVIDGTTILGFDVLNKMGKPVSVGTDWQDIREVCQAFLQRRYDFQKNNIPSTYALSLLTRIKFSHINGYNWDNIQQRVKEIQQKLGLTKKKKY